MDSQGGNQDGFPSNTGGPGQHDFPSVTQHADEKDHKTGPESQLQAEGYLDNLIDVSDHHSSIGGVAKFQAGSEYVSSDGIIERDGLPMSAAALLNKISELNNRNLELMLDKKEHMRSISILQAENWNLEQERNNALERISAAEQTISDLTRNVNSLGDENTQLEFAVEDLQVCLKENLAKNDQKLEDQQVRHDAEIVQLERNLGTLRGQLAAKDRQQKAEEARVGDLKADRARLKAVVEQLQKLVVDGVGGQKEAAEGDERLEKALLRRQERSLGDMKPALYQPTFHESESPKFSTTVPQLATVAIDKDIQFSHLESDKNLIREAIKQLANHSARIESLEVQIEAQSQRRD